MTFGAGRYTYTVDPDWPKRPSKWTYGWSPGMACDSRNRIFVYTRCDHPLLVFDTSGHLLDSWGEGFLTDAHGIYIDKDDCVFCVERNPHCIHKFDPDGKLIMTIGTPGQPGAKEGDPFNRPTDLAISSAGDLFISDGYGNSRMHKYTADGKHVLSWGELGTGPGQFDLSHCVRIDRYDRLWVCDRNNRRIQFFDTEGRYLDEWGGLLQPNQVWFAPDEDVVYITELDGKISIYTFDRVLLAQWGKVGKEPSDAPGYFVGGPHGICMDAEGSLYVGEVFADGRWHRYVRE